MNNPSLLRLKLSQFNVTLPDLAFPLAGPFPFARTIGDVVTGASGGGGSDGATGAFKGEATSTFTVVVDFPLSKRRLTNSPCIEVSIYYIRA